MTSDRGSRSTFVPPLLSSGILVSQTIREMVRSQVISGLVPVQPCQIQPSSLDLRLGARIWQLRCSFMPGAGRLEQKLENFAMSCRRLDGDPVLLTRGGVYLAEVEESLDLPPGVAARASPKSSTGRLDVFVRLLTEHATSFDVVPPGYQGRLYVEIAPQSFHVLVRRGDCLSQVRFSSGSCGVLSGRLEEIQGDPGERICIAAGGGPAPVSGDSPSLEMSVDLEGSGGVVGYVARRNSPPVDVRARGLDVLPYWEAMRWTDVGHILEPEQLYVFATRESLRVPPGYCAELVVFDATRGELRTHYAGFIDSGFGWERGAASAGARLVVEVRTHDVPFLIEHGQPLFRVEVMRNECTPDVLYGSAGNNYQMQGLRLAKQFAQ